DAQRLAARFMNALDIVPPEVRDHADCKESGKLVRGDFETQMKQFRRLIHKAAKILARADSAYRARQDVIKNEGRNRKPGEKLAHGVAHENVHPAANVHAAAFHVNGPYCEAEQHDAQDEPRSASTDGLFRNTACIKCRRGEIAEYDRRTSPERDER